jgi:hypothetical protein
MMNIKDETGNKYGRLTVLARVDNTKGRPIYWRCRCDCGKETTVRGWSLRSGDSKSCGCLIREITSARTLGKVRAESYHWTGGRYKDTDGYTVRMVSNHHQANGRGYALEHRLVMEKMLGCPLPDGAVVHHCNGDRSDNRPYNLRLFLSNGKHAAYHQKLKRDGVSL